MMEEGHREGLTVQGMTVGVGQHMEPTPEGLGGEGEVLGGGDIVVSEELATME